MRLGSIWMLLGLAGIALALSVAVQGGDDPRSGMADESAVSAESQHSDAGPAGHTEAGEDHEEEHGEHENRWYDRVHYVGVVGGLLAILALVAGLSIAVRHAKGGGIMARMTARKWHMLAGLGAIAFALAHTIGRARQHGELEFELGGSQLTVLLFLLAGMAGGARHRPFASLQAYPAVTVWLHRVAVIAMFVFLVLHGLHEYESWTGGQS